MKMRTIRIHAYGGPEVMQLEEQALPLPGPGQALVRVHAAGVNFLDIQERRGDLASQHFYQASGISVELGLEGAGVIEAIDPEVSHLKVGDRVAWAGVNGSYASHILAPAYHLIPIPDEMSFEQAAAVLFQGMTAYVLTHLAYPIKPDDWCLVQAAAGGIGLLLCQMAKRRGGRVIGITSTQEKAQAVHKVGVQDVLISTLADQVQDVRRISGGQGVQVVYDGIGKATFEANLDSLAPCGSLLIYGQASGFIPPFDLMTLMEKGSLFITRVAAYHYLRDPQQASRCLQDLFTWLLQGQLSVKIDRTYPLAEAALAHQAMEQRQTSGKVLLLP
ncbi:quinone oxidoreductase [Ktedonosporobacter rubrisoli]|uniref:Quinone oxidoreductase n=1 Tax=Ktedonosporobacter rubrisoli TaxID=2509675 RepID=A0A4P6JJ19_KTERU|nr:quinone oxidoreductase [Ktedonosporobacter rubrisoli]QBD74910.1 quinone oxidoreductase [Ktedonosporobacter rubrisoli]